jgi:hypothetical protein
MGDIFRADVTALRAGLNSVKGLAASFASRSEEELGENPADIKSLLMKIIDEADKALWEEGEATSVVDELGGLR